MSTNKKFRIQNGVDITGEVVVGNQLVITAEGKLVLPAITEAVNEAVATDIAALQAQVDAILGTSPEHLDTLQEIVALFQSEDGDISTLITNNSTAITQIQQTLASGVATAAQGALADTAAQQADLDAVIAQITDGVATAAQGALADTAVQPEDFGAGIVQGVGVSDWSASQMGSEINVGTSYAVGFESEAIATSDLYYVTSTTTNNNSNGNINLLVWDKSVASPAVDGWHKDLSSSLPNNADNVTHLEMTDEYVFVGFSVNGGSTANGLLAIKISDGTVYRDFKSIVDASGQGGWVADYNGRGGADGHGHKFDIDDKYIAIVSRTSSNIVIVVDYTTGQWVRNYTFTGAKDLLEVAVDSGKMLVSGYRSNDLKYRVETAELVDISSGSVLHTLTLQHAQVSDPNWNGIGWGGTVLLSGDYAVVGSMHGTSNNGYINGKLDVFDVSTGSHIVTLSEDYNTVTNNFASGLSRGATDLYGSYLVATTSDDKAYVYDLSTSSSDALTVLTLPASMGARVVVSSTGAVFNEWAGKTPNGSNASVVNVIVPSSTPLVVDTSTIATKAYVDSGVAGVDLSGYTETSGMTSAIATAKSEAISTASTDATAKADAAQAAASADATAKADQAETDAKAYADQVVAATVDAAPAALDTLNELAAALGDDANFASTVTASLADKATAADLTALEAQITGGVATVAQGALADTALQPEDFSTGFGTTVSTVIDYSSEGTFSAPSTIINTTPSGESLNYGKLDGNSTHVAYYFTNPLKVSLFTKEGSLVGSTNLTKFGGFTFTEEHLAVHDAGIVTVYDMDMNVVNTFSISMDSVNTLQPRPMVFSGDTLIVATGSVGGTLKVYNWTTGADVSTISLTARTYDLDGMHPIELSDMSVSGNKLFVGNIRGGTSAFNGGVHVVDLTSYTEINVINSPVGGKEGFGYHLESDDDYLVVYRQRKDEGSNERVNGALEFYSVSDYTHLGTVKDGTAYSFNDLEFAGNASFKGFDLVDGYVIASSGQHLDNKLYFINCGDLSTHSINMESALGMNHSPVGMVNVCGADIILTFAHRHQYDGSYQYFMVKVTAESFSDTTSFVVDDSVFATKDYVDSGVAGVDLSGYSTTVEMDSAIAVETAARTAAIAAIPATDLTTYSTTVEMGSAIATAKTEAQTYADQVVAATVDAAPAALDTLNELAAALGDDANFASTVTASIATKADDAATTAALDGKVDSLKSFSVVGDGINAGTPVTMNTDGTLSKAVSGVIASWSKSESDFLTGEYWQFIDNPDTNQKKKIGLKTFEIETEQRFLVFQEGVGELKVIVGGFDSEGKPEALTSSPFPWQDYYEWATGWPIGQYTTWGSQNAIYTYAINETSGYGIAILRYNINSPLVAVSFTVVNDAVIWQPSSKAKKLSVKPASGKNISDIQVWNNAYWANDDRVTPGSGLTPWGDSEFIFHAGEAYGNGTAIIGLGVSSNGTVVQKFYRGRSPVTWQYPSSGSSYGKHSLMMGGMNNFDSTYYIVKTSQDGSKYDIIVFDMDQYSSSQYPVLDDPQATYLELDADVVTGTAFDSTTGNMLVHYFSGTTEKLAAYNSGVLVSDTVLTSGVPTPTALTMSENQSSIEVSDSGLIITSRRENSSATQSSSNSSIYDFVLGNLYIETRSSATSTTPVDSYEVIRPGLTSGASTNVGTFWGIEPSSGSVYGLAYRFIDNNTGTYGGGHDYNPTSSPAFSFIKSVAQIDSTKYIGIASGTPSNDVVSVVISGGISSGHTGLTPSSIYYVQTDGSLGTTQTSLKAGVAISTTEIKVSDNLSDALTDLSPYATKDYVDSGVAGVDLSGYSTTVEMDSAIAVETAARTAAIAAIPSTDLTPYSTTVEMDSAIAAIPATDLTPYSTTVEMDSAIATAKSEAQSYADQVVASTIDAAPASLDTLNELAAALGDDANFASTVTASIATKADDAATTAALASKVGLAEVDVRMEPIKQLAESAIQPSDLGAGITTSTTTVSDWGPTATYTTDSLIATPPSSAYGTGSNSTHFAVYNQGYLGGQQAKYMNLYTMDGAAVKQIGVADDAVAIFSETNLALVVAGTATVYDLNGDPVSSWSVPFTNNKRGFAFYGSDKLVIGGQSNSVYVYDWTNGTLLSTIIISTGAEIASISVSGDKAFVGNWRGGSSNSGQVVIIDLSTNTIESTISNPAGSVSDDQFGMNVKSNDTHFVVSRKNGAGSYRLGSVEVFKISDNSHMGSVQSSSNSNIELGFGFAKQRIQLTETRVLVLGTSSDVAKLVSAPLSTPTTDVKTITLGHTHNSGEIALSGSDIIILGGNRISKLSTLTEDETTNYGVDTSVFATKDYVDSGVAGVDLSDYSTTAQMDSAIAAIPSTDLTPYSTTAQMDSAIAVETGARETAVTSAISTASDDATAKANAAQAAAEATAAADATAKADAAQAAAIAAAGTAATQAIAATVDVAPASLDTLNELAAALGDDANFASTVTASIASKVGLAEVDVRMEPIKQTAESAIQPSDLGTGIAEVSSSVVDWSSLTSEDFAAISDTDLLYTKELRVVAVDASDTHFVTLVRSSVSGETDPIINVHLLDGTLVKSWTTDAHPELTQPWLSHLSINGNYISLSRITSANQSPGTGAYSKIFDIRNIAQADHGVVKTIIETNLRRLFTIDDTRAIAVYGTPYTAVDTVKVHNISDWAELYSYDPMGNPVEADFGGGYFVTGGTTGNTNQGVTILKTSGAYGLAGTVFSTTIHGPSNNTAMFANGIAVSDKYVVFRTQDTDGTNRAHVHNPDDGSHIRSFVEESSTPWQVLRNSKGQLGKVALALSGDVLFIPLVDYTHSAPYHLKKGVAVYNILTGELLNELTMFDGDRYIDGNGAEDIYNIYTVGGSTIIDINEELVDAGSISPRIATAPTASVVSYGVDTSVFATKDYVDSGVDGNEGRLTTTENNLTALEADLSSEENARGAGDTALGLRLDSDKSELDTAIGSLSARLDSDKSELGAAIDAAIEQEVQTPLDLEIGRGSKSLRVGRNTVANTDGGIAIGDAANAAGAKSIALGTSATPTGDNGIEIKTSEDGTLSYSSDSDWSFGAPVTAPSFIGDGSGLTGISSDVTGAIAAEETRATTAEAGLQSQISNVLSNTDATALNSLAEIVTEFQNADSTLSGVIGGHGTRLTDLEGRTTDNIPEGITNKYYSDELVKTALSGGLCINDTKLQATGEIAVDEVEAEQSLRVAEAVVSDDTSKLEGQGGSHYRIDIYDVNGVIIND